MRSPVPNAQPKAMELQVQQVILAASFFEKNLFAYKMICLIGYMLPACSIANG